MFRVSLHFDPLSMQRLQRGPEQKCANEAQICRHLAVDTATYAAPSPHISPCELQTENHPASWQTDTSIIYLQLIYVAPITGTTHLQQHSDRQEL